jgi:hypothetical protein
MRGKGIAISRPGNHNSEMNYTGASTVHSTEAQKKLSFYGDCIKSSRSAISGGLLQVLLMCLSCKQERSARLWKHELSAQIPM